MKSQQLPRHPPADYLHVPQAVKAGYIRCCPGGVFDISYPNSKLRRARVQGGGVISGAVTCESGMVLYRLFEL